MRSLGLFTSSILAAKAESYLGTIGLMLSLLPTVIQLIWDRLLLVCKQATIAHSFKRTFQYSAAICTLYYNSTVPVHVRCIPRYVYCLNHRIVDHLIK